MTQGEMEGLKEAVGAREATRDYNVVIDGYGTGLAPPTREEWDDAVGNLKVVDSVSSVGDAPAATFDISSEPHFPAVGNQGSQGSCAAWAMTYYAYGYLEARDNLWTDASTGNPDHLMSPAWTYNKVNGGGSGSWMSDNGNIIQDWGTATLAAMPYDDGDSFSWGSQVAWRVAPLHRASEVYLIHYEGDETVTSVKNLLSNHIPVTFALDAGEFGPSFYDGGTVMSAAEYSSTDLNHAQTFVGYDDSVGDDGEVGAFKVVNSWGTHDGYTDHGYYWMTYDCFMEIGSLLFLTYVADISSYVPSMLSVWHFNSAPSRNADIQVGLGPHDSPLDSKSPYYEFDSDVPMPTFMCVDMSEFEEEYDAGTEEFYLEIGASSTAGTVSSFRIEHYEGGYVPGIADQASSQSPDVPSSNPSYLTNNLHYYSPMPIGSGLDNVTLSFNGGGIAGWVFVDHHSYQDGDSAQSGDVGDSAYTYLSTNVEGPVNLSFYWKVSSQTEKDFLRLYVDSVEVESISGEVDWQNVSRTLYAGTHAIVWQYSKDGSISSGEDCGWV
ncbi:MAG: C1 family peptidase, partial [Methanomassiliicoccales archaeon]|nr:C1 family peptidase [Methanomassiliicoccales archaeon]